MCSRSKAPKHCERVSAMAAYPVRSLRRKTSAGATRHLLKQPPWRGRNRNVRMPRRPLAITVKHPQPHELLSQHVNAHLRAQLRRAPPQLNQPLSMYAAHRDPAPISSGALPGSHSACHAQMDCLYALPRVVPVGSTTFHICSVPNATRDFVTSALQNSVRAPEQSMQSDLHAASAVPPCANRIWPQPQGQRWD